MIPRRDVPERSGAPPARTVTRAQMIDHLRERCLSYVDDEHSLCEVASRLKILCGGFSQWTFHELKRRYDWIARSRPGITRKELEDLANRWQLARQAATGTRISCDTQMEEGQSRIWQHKVCRGWDSFTNEDLARFWGELVDERVDVVGDDPGESDA